MEMRNLMRLISNGSWNEDKKARILEVLNKDPELTNHQISERFGITPSTASQYIHLWKKGRDKK